MYFLYNNFDISTATVTDGTAALVSSTWTFTSSDVITGEYGINDYSLNFALTNLANNDVLQLNLGSSKTITDAAIYAGDTTGQVNVRAGGAITYENTPLLTLNPADGWAIGSNTITGSYIYVSFTGATGGVAEIILGKKLTFEVNPDISMQTMREVDARTSEGWSGKQYKYRIADSRRVWEMTWANISNTEKTNFETLRDTVQGSLNPMIFNDDSSTYFVRASDDSFQFQQIADGRWSTSCTLTEVV